MVRLIAALAAAVVVGMASSAVALPKVGQPAPNFTVTTFAGKDISLKDLKGQVVIVNFWATWCGPCLRELPLLDAYLKVQQKYGLALIAVTTQDDIEPDQLRPLSRILTVPLARRFRGGGYGEPRAMPTNYVIDRAGVVRYAQEGAFDLDTLNEVVVPLLKEPAPDLTPAAAAPIKPAAR